MRTLKDAIWDTLWYAHVISGLTATLPGPPPGFVLAPWEAAASEHGQGTLQPLKITKTAWSKSGRERRPVLLRCAEIGTDFPRRSARCELCERSKTLFGTHCGMRMLFPD